MLFLYAIDIVRKYVISETIPITFATILENTHRPLYFVYFNVCHDLRTFVDNFDHTYQILFKQIV